MNQKLIVILGPTAAGKSALGIKLAKKFHGEIISADSRQVYKGMDLGTGKVTKQEQKLVPHHLLDVAAPKKQFTVADFVKLGQAAIKKIAANNHLPFIVGGTPFYIYSLVDGWSIPDVKPDPKLRRELETKTLSELLKILKKLDPARLRRIDKHNRARLVRAIEIVKATGRPVPQAAQVFRPHQNVLFLGVSKTPEELRRLINKRVDQRLKQGMIKEVQKLHKAGLSFDRLYGFGLEYRFISLFLQDLLTKKQMAEQLKTAIWQFSKRQMTWFKHDPRIHWIKNETQASKLTKDFLTHFDTVQ
jgi:tRNA dimethylallyltransferase